LIFSAIWFVSGAAVGLGIESLSGVDVVLLCGATNMATGLIALAVVLRAEKARQAFYGEDERGGLALAVLVALPVAALLFGVLWWVMEKLFPLP